MPLRLLILAVVLFAVSACGTLLGRGHWDPFLSSSERRLAVVVDNRNGSPVAVRALAPGRRLGLGSVQGNSRTRFSIPWSVAQEIRFQIEPAGGRSHTTVGLRVYPGDLVEVSIRDPIQQSMVRR